jgi:hypothetical protein
MPPPGSGNEEGRHHSLLGGVRAFLSHPLLFFALTRRSLEFRLLPYSVHLGYPRLACGEPRDQPCTRPNADVQVPGGRGGGRRRTPSPTRRQQLNRYQVQSTYDNSNATVSPFTDIMINRLPSAPTNPSTTSTRRQPSLCRRLNYQPHVSIFYCTYYHHHCSHNHYDLPCHKAKYGRV